MQTPVETADSQVLPEEQLEVHPLKGSTYTAQVGLHGLRLLRDGEQVPVGWNCWRILDEEYGDRRVPWDPNDLASIRGAKAHFDDLIAQGMVPHICAPDGTPTGEIMREFDPGAGEVVFIPIGAVAGG